MFAPAPATAPPALAELDEQWSRIVTVPTGEGTRSFHVLDSLPALRAAGVEPTGTIVALHGNPTWSYMWRRLISATLDAAQHTAQHTAGPHATPNHRIWRVIAPDQLEMGYSERLSHPGLPTPLSTDPTQRRIAQRVRDLDAVIGELTAEVAATSGPDHPLVTLGHDWGGVLSLTWAARHLDRVAAVATLNTAVWHQDDDKLPAALRAALTGPVLPFSTVRTDAFLRATLALAKNMPAEVAAAFRSPYTTPQARHGIGQFVADIPATADHPSYAELGRLSADIAHIDTPALILWGPKDPVFKEMYLRDLRKRLPQADIHRFEGTGHLLSEEVDYAATVLEWLETKLPAGVPAATGTPATTSTQSGASHTVVFTRVGRQARLGDPTSATWIIADQARKARETYQRERSASQTPMIFDALEARHTDPGLASVDMATGTAISWAQLSHVVNAVALGLQHLGLTPGERVSLLVPPGNNLTAAAYAVLKAGGVAVVADAGLGVAGMTRAIRAADPQWIIGDVPGLTLARGAGWPGRRISVSPLGPVLRAGLGVETSVTELSRRAVRPGETLHTPNLDDDAAVLFTSGSTGPAKGVRYTHRALGSLATVLARHFDVRPGTGLVAGFPPFALLGPGIGAHSVTPDMSVTKPRTLTAAALADAVAAGECTMVFASPAAYTNVVATADDLTAAQREACARVELALSAGAPVSLELMRGITRVFPNASVHSPYGMTEGLLLSDITAAEVADIYGESLDGGAFAVTGGKGQAEVGLTRGVCVGRPLDGVRFALAPIGPDGTPADAPVDISADPAENVRAGIVGVLGEFVVSARHLKTGYDRLWLTDTESKRDSTTNATFHRTNDVGHVDDQGRLWIEGRLQHVITTADGPVGPGAVEAVVDGVDGVYRSAAVGVGPTGTQALAVVLESTGNLRPGLADLDLTQTIRTRVLDELGLDVAAVLVARDFPTDIRHNSKIDRTALTRWAQSQLG